MHAIALLISEKENRLLIQFITMLKDNPFFSAMNDASLLIITVAAGLLIITVAAGLYTCIGLDRHGGRHRARHIHGARRA